MNNLLFRFMNLLGDGESVDWLTDILDPIKGVIESIIVPVLIIIATVGLVYAIVLGVNYAKAETSDQKEEAKKRIINVVVGALLMIVLMLLLYLFIGNAKTIIDWVSGFGKKQ